MIGLSYQSLNNIYDVISLMDVRVYVYTYTHTHIQNSGCINPAK